MGNTFDQSRMMESRSSTRPALKLLPILFMLSCGPPELRELQHRFSALAPPGTTIDAAKATLTSLGADCNRIDAVIVRQSDDSVSGPVCRLEERTFFLRRTYDVVLADSGGQVSRVLVLLHRPHRSTPRSAIDPLMVVVVVLALLGVQALAASKAGSGTDIQTILGATQPPNWHFVALQYWFGILNRTYVVFVTERMVCGGKARGLLAAPVVPTERWRDPYFYPRRKWAARYQDVALESPEFLQLNRANFHLTRGEIDSVEVTMAPKWGMGNVPYSGRLLLSLRNGERIEFILLGTQDAFAIRDRLVAAGFGSAAA